MKKRISIILALSILYLVLWNIPGLNLQKNNQIFTGSAMTMNYKIIAGDGLNKTEAIKIQSIINKTFAEIDAIYNKWNPKSELSKLNQAKKNEKIKISEKLETFLKQTANIVLLSNNKFDPTIEPLQNLWKEKLKKGTIPTSEEIQSLNDVIGWDKIHVENGFFFKDHDHVKLDLGGIAKGFAVDLVVLRLNEAGFNDVFVEWGGEIKATGKHFDNRPWHIFISRLEDKNPENSIAHIDLQDKAIATSGDYLQHWTVKENNKIKTYFHIFDPVLKAPLEIKRGSIASTSVIANSCVVADALATVLMMFESKEEAAIWGEKMKEYYPEIEFWIVSRSDL